MWGYFFHICEAAGKWPRAILYFAFYLQPKVQGGFRTIGLLPEIYRIWGKLKMAMVRAWAATVPRNYFAAGEGKSTEQAVGKMLLTTEGMEAREQEAVTVVMDIDKCYEHVGHRRLFRAAISFRFPLAIARLAIRMYRAARTLQWEGAFASWVYAGRSLVPGCSIAVYLLQLVMLEPLDEFVGRTLSISFCNHCRRDREDREDREGVDRWQEEEGEEGEGSSRREEKAGTGKEEAGGRGGSGESREAGGNWDGGQLALRRFRTYFVPMASQSVGGAGGSEAQ